jgi:hypothetical protein
MRSWNLESFWKLALLVLFALSLAFLVGHGILTSDSPTSPGINPAAPTGR